MEELHPYQDGLGSSGQGPEITGIVTMLEGKRDEAVSSRSEVESRWIRDLQQFDGVTVDRMSKGDQVRSSGTRKTPPHIHITRSRTLAIAARIINMLVPSNERSWDIEPTPVPSLTRAQNDNTPVMDPRTGQQVMMPVEEEAEAIPPSAPGMPPQGMDPNMPPEAMEGMAPEGMPPEQPAQRPVTRADLVKRKMEDAEDRASRMREHMDDQLTECRYNGEQRKIIIDGCKIGTGVLEGPVVGGSYKKQRFQLEDGTWVTQSIDEPAAQFKAVDPWHFYPMAAEHISKCEGVFIEKPMTRRELQELKTIEGFDRELINEVLREEPYHSEQYSNSIRQRSDATGQALDIKGRYGVWKYVGCLSRKDMESLGVDVDEELDLVDPMIEAWFVNTRLIKIKRHALEGAYRLPFYVWNYEECETSMFGFGVPYLMRDSDRVIQSTWHMMLHNAALSAGPQLVRRKGAIEPADGDENITGGMKQWYLADPEQKVSDAFQVFHIEARLEELAAIHDRARENADEELAFPLIAQGEPTEAVPTSSGLAMLMNASNVVQRRIAQSFDDDIIEPSISALYDWNMIYLEDDDAKGDMTIKPMGATKLVVKDMQTQHLITIATLTTNDRFAPLMDDKELLKAILKAAEVDADGLMKTDEELEGMGPTEAETLELERLKAEIRETNAKAAQMEAGQGQEGQQGPAPMSESEYAELQFRYDRMDVDMQLGQMKMEQAAIETAGRTDIALADIQAKFELGTRAEENKRLRAEMEERRKQVTEGYMARLKAEEVGMKKANMSRGYDTF